jgi:hypothetical protein
VSAIFNEQFAGLRSVLKVNGSSASPELVWACKWAATKSEHMVGEAKSGEIRVINGDAPATTRTTVAI